MSEEQHEVGTALDSMVTMYSLGLHNPKCSYRPGSDRRFLASGKVRDVGYPVITWYWGFLKQPHIDALRDYFSEASNHLFIRSHANRNEDELRCYEVYSRWPFNEEKDTNVRLDFQIEFVVIWETQAIFVPSVSLVSTALNGTITLG